MINLKSLGILIKKNRKSSRMTVEELAEKSSYSRSYISNIENGVIEATEDIYAVIFDSLGIKYMFNNDCKEFDDELNIVLRMYLYLNIDADFIAGVIAKGNDYRISTIFPKYMIVRLIHYVVSKPESANIEHYIEEMKILVNQFHPKEQQIIYDYMGCHYLNSDNQKALMLFKKGLSCGEYGEVSSILNYHISLLYQRMNNYCKALRHSNKALSLFCDELNFKRQYYTKLNIAIIWSKNGDYEDAISELNNLTNIPNLDLTSISDLNSNFCWTNIKKGDYDAALKYALKCEKQSSEYFYHLAIIYLKLNMKQEMNTIVSEGLKYHKENEYQKVRMEIIKGDANHLNGTIEYEKLLKKAEKIMSNNGDQESIEMVYSKLINFYENKYRYKEAFKYLKKLNDLKC